MSSVRAIRRNMNRVPGRSTVIGPATRFCAICGKVATKTTGRGVWWCGKECWRR